MNIHKITDGCLLYLIIVKFKTGSLNFSLKILMHFFVPFFFVCQVIIIVYPIKGESLKQYFKAFIATVKNKKKIDKKPYI